MMGICIASQKQQARIAPSPSYVEKSTQTERYLSKEAFHQSQRHKDQLHVARSSSSLENIEIVGRKLPLITSSFEKSTQTDRYLSKEAFHQIEIVGRELPLIRSSFEKSQRHGEKLPQIRSSFEKSTQTEEYIFRKAFHQSQGHVKQLTQLPSSFEKSTQTEEYIFRKAFYQIEQIVTSDKKKRKKKRRKIKTDLQVEEITNVSKENTYHKEMEKETYFQILRDVSCLPRYTYHRSLVDWYMGGIPKDITFTGCQLESCLIIIGGNITTKEKKMMFGETALSERLDLKDLGKEAENHAAFLVVYFFIGDLTKMGEDIEKLDLNLPLKRGHGHVLVVVEMDFSNDTKVIIEKIMTLGITNVEIVIKTRSEIVLKITCILERIISSYLLETKKLLLDHSHSHKVNSSLLEVNAILKRLKQAECDPEPQVEFMEAENNEIDNILQRFAEKILYSVYDGNTLYIIASDQNTKENLETLFSESGFQNISFVITVEDKLSISELSKTGVPLHGAKFVYVNMGTEAFNTDECFATTGSLMQANNNSLMVAVTCRHALEREDNFYTLIDNSVVKLGQEVKQPNNRMERLHEDIAVVRIDEATRPIVDEKCEKLLIDTSKLPSPARISDRILVKGDIVHKRGARTGLTTGIVRDVRTQKIGRFSEQSRVIFITGRDSTPFAEKGDSGSLVFQHSLDPEEKRLEVVAMVQGKVKVPIPNADVICFPFIEGCENLQNNIQDIQNLDFFNH